MRGFQRLRITPLAVVVLAVGCGRITHSIGQTATEAGSGGIPETGAAGVSGSGPGSPAAGSHSGGSDPAEPPVPGVDASAAPGDGGGRRDAAQAGGAPPDSRPEASGGASGSDNDAGTDPSACVAEKIAVEARQLDVYIMMDAAVRGMTLALGSASSGISEFVDDPRSSGLGVGIQFFGISCDPDSYRSPAVEVAPLPANAAAIKRSYPAVPFSTSPVVPALEGAIAHARQRASTPGLQDRKQVVFLVTAQGGVDPFCGFGGDSLGAVASEGLSGPSPVETYVIGLGFFQWGGGSLADLDALRAFLDNVASQGGTIRAYMALLDDVAGPPLAERLQEARAAAAPCEYGFPAQDSMGNAIDPDLVTLEYQTRDGVVHEVPRVSSAADCLRSSPGWYFEDATSPQWMAVCSATCESLKSDSVQQVSVAVDCGS